MTVRLHLAIVLVAMSAACASNPRSRASDGPALRDGRYTFTERPSGTNVNFEGSFVVLLDTVMVDATPGPCVYDTGSSRGGGIVYHCLDITLSFDREDPVQKARYSFIASEQKPKSVCVRYTTSPTGQQVCAQTAIEMQEIKTRKTGTLRPQRVQASDSGRP